MHVLRNGPIAVVAAMSCFQHPIVLSLELLLPNQLPVNFLRVRVRVPSAATPHRVSQSPDLYLLEGGQHVPRVLKTLFGIDLYGTANQSDQVVVHPSSEPLIPRIGTGILWNVILECSTVGIALKRKGLMGLFILTPRFGV